MLVPCGHSTTTSRYAFCHCQWPSGPTKTSPPGEIYTSSLFFQSLSLQLVPQLPPCGSSLFCVTLDCTACRCQMPGCVRHACVWSMATPEQHWQLSWAGAHRWQHPLLARSCWSWASCTPRYFQCPLESLPDALGLWQTSPSTFNWTICTMRIAGA